MLRQHPRRWLCWAAGVLMLGLGGCKTPGDEAAAPPAPETTGSIAADVAAAEDQGTIAYVPSNEPLKTGLAHFQRGEYGLAERYFRDAVEKNPRDTPAWIGLAASYDRLARFDLADRAYAIALGLAGETTEILNNQGYSYMLRGDLKTARVKLTRALKREPNNPTVLNNLALLNSSGKFKQR